MSIPWLTADEAGGIIAFLHLRRVGLVPESV
jgi:hypothetical protein